MDLRLSITTFALCCGVCLWFFLGNKSEIDYERHPQLVDPKTGAKLQPNQLLKLSKIMNLTSSYINSTNAHQRLYDLEYQLNFENPFLIDQSYSNPNDLMISGWPVANHTLCAAHLNWILAKLDANQNFTYLTGELGFELTSLIDTFGKPQSSAFSGSVHWLGSYKRCSGLSLDKGRIKTRYCIGKMRPQSWPTDETIYPRTRIRFGMCLPESCDTGSFEKQRLSIERLAKYDLSEFYKSDLQLDSMFCLPDERSPLRKIPTSGLVYLYTIFGWLFIIVAASLVDEWRSRKDSSKRNVNQDNIIRALSLRQSFDEFMRNPFSAKSAANQPRRVKLSCINCLKVIMTIAIFFSHSTVLNLAFARSGVDRIELGVSFAGRTSLYVGRFVDTFFMIFGVLGTYTSLRKFSSHQLSQPLIWLNVNIGTFLRIAPIFALVYWYSRSIAPYTGSGPWWDYGVSRFSMKQVCILESPWKSIPYFGSFGAIQYPACLLPGWFLVSYSHIALLLPVLTYVMVKMPSYVLRVFFIGFLLMISALSVGLRLYKQTSIPEEAFWMYGGLLVNLLENFESTGHLTTISHLGCVAFGCLVGYLLRMYEIGKIKQWPTWLTSGWLLTLVILAHLFAVFSPAISLFYLRPISLREFIAGDMILFFLWPILNGLILINLTTTYNESSFVRFCDHSFWTVTNKLGLLMYLVHWELMYTQITGFEEGPTYGFSTDILKLCAYGLLLSTPLSFILYLLVEAPLSRIVSILLEQKRKDTIKYGPIKASGALNECKEEKKKEENGVIDTVT